MADKKEIKIDHSNPFNKGVTYESFLKEVKGKKIKDFLKGKCTPLQISWIETELENYTNNTKTK
jgi:hypothetical protein